MDLSKFQDDTIRAEWLLAEMRTGGTGGHPHANRGLGVAPTKSALTFSSPTAQMGKSTARSRRGIEPKA